MTITTFTIDTIKAVSGSGGGFYLTNTADTSISITTGTITTNSKATTSGGFIYQSGGTTFELTLSSFTANYP
jgi:hypothetical protein